MPSATALFWFVLPPDPAVVPEEHLVVHAHDLGRPVITFASVDKSPDCVWVSVDAHWAGAGSSSDAPSAHVLLLQLALDSVSCDSYRVTSIINGITQASEISPSPSLLSTLNGASAIPGAPTYIYPPPVLKHACSYRARDIRAAVVRIPHEPPEKHRRDSQPDDPRRRVRDLRVRDHSCREAQRKSCGEDAHANGAASARRGNSRRAACEEGQRGGC